MLVEGTPFAEADGPRPPSWPGQDAHLSPEGPLCKLKLQRQGMSVSLRPVPEDSGPPAGKGLQSRPHHAL